MPVDRGFLSASIYMQQYRILPTLTLLYYLHLYYYMLCISMKIPSTSIYISSSYL